MQFCLHTLPVFMLFSRTEKKEKPTLTPLVDIECVEQQDVCFETTLSGKPEPTVDW